MLEDSPCTGVCRMEKVNNEVRCISCKRTYKDISEWFNLNKQQRLDRMKQLKQGK